MHCRQRWTSATIRRWPPSDNALVGFARQQVLVGGGQLVRERQAGLRRFQRVTGQRMRRARVQPLELRPQRDRGVPVDLGELQTPRVTHRDAVGRRERVADDPRRLDRLLLAVSASHSTMRAGRVSGGFAGFAASGGRFSAREVGMAAGETGRPRLYATSCSIAPHVARSNPGSETRASMARRRSASNGARRVGALIAKEVDDRLDLVAGPAASARGRRPRTRRAGAAGRAAVIARAVDRGQQVRFGAAQHAASGMRSRPRAATGPHRGAASRNGTAMPGVVDEAEAAVGAPRRRRARRDAPIAHRRAGRTARCART